MMNVNFIKMSSFGLIIITSASIMYNYTGFWYVFIVAFLPKLVNVISSLFMYYFKTPIILRVNPGLVYINIDNWLAIIEIAIIAPIIEEFAVTYCLFGILRKLVNPELALFIKAIIFGILHIDMRRLFPKTNSSNRISSIVLNIITLSVFGYYSALVYLLYDNIVISIAAHSLFNTLTLVGCFIMKLYENSPKNNILQFEIKNGLFKRRYSFGCPPQWYFGSVKKDHLKTSMDTAVENFKLANKN